MLTITVPSRITQETEGFFKEQGCISSKHAMRFDLIAERKSTFFENDGGHD